jgi:hypothetical protein
MILFVQDKNMQQFKNVFRKMIVMKEMDFEGIYV